MILLQVLINNDSCVILLLKILDNNEYYFSTDKQGLIETAGLRPKECMDDCFRGYHIRDFSWLSESNKIDTKGKKGKKDNKKRKH